MNPYNVYFPVLGNLQEMRNAHLDIMEGSGYQIVDGPYLDFNKKGTVHRYVVERIK